MPTLETLSMPNLWVNSSTGQRGIPTTLQTAAVLGAGVMGVQIAAHLANAGLTVYLLDLPAGEGQRDGLAQGALQQGLKMSPPLFFSEKAVRRVIPSNYEDCGECLLEADWIIEAVVENLAVKRQLLERLLPQIRADAIVSTNTSGLPIREIIAGFPEDLQRRFLGTHFFNPPRYLKLLEVIATPQTDPRVVDRIIEFAEIHLGKGVVRAKDTPNFIANRIGLYATMLGLAALERGYTIAEVELLTGPLVGRSKSATFRTVDLVGLDTLQLVAENLYPAIPEDESRDRFRVPLVLRRLVEYKALGAKTGRGFYQKQGGQILTVDLAALEAGTLQYGVVPPVEDLGNLAGLEALPLTERVRSLYRDLGRAGQLFRWMTWELLGYAARRIPEIAEDPAMVDRALRWGFGWEIGPFDLWERLGTEIVLADLLAQGAIVPSWVLEKGLAPVGQPQAAAPGSALRTGPSLEDLDLGAIASDPVRVLWQNPEAALLDLGDGVALYEFRSKGNTLSFQVIAGLAASLDWLETGPKADRFHGLVIGNRSANFCGGANLVEMGMLAQTGNWDGIRDLITRFQALMQRLHFFPKPIVAAVQGRALGGGCELVLACPHVVAAAETYIGLVEVGVGLIPGAGGIVRSVIRAVDRAPGNTLADVMPFLRQTFETIATARVSTSAEDAQHLGYLPDTARILMHGDRRLAVAKAEVLHLAAVGYQPPAYRHDILALGQPARAILDHAAYVAELSGQASAHDRFLAGRLAYVMTGGDLSVPALVSEDYLLHLEREAFVPLLSEPKTQARMEHLLRTKKMLRN